MKILFFINNISCSGGSERAASVLAGKLSERGHEVTLLSWMGGANKPFFKLHEKITVLSLYQQEVNIYKTYAPGIIKYHQVLNRVQPQLVIDVCTAISLFSVPMRLFHRYKLFSWEHFNTSVNWNAFTPRLARWLVAKFATRVIVLTETDKRNYEDNFGAKNVVKISNPLTVEHSLRSNLESNKVIAIGRFTPQKGFDLLLQSWKMVINELPHLKLVLVGDGELKPQIRQLANDLKLDDNIEWVNPTPHIETYFQEASLFVMSSRFEGLPLVLIEAKSFGLPIISFDCETGPREIIHHGVDGFLVPNGNTRALADEIIELMKSAEKRKEFGSQAWLDVKRFEINGIVEQWLNLIS